MIHALRLRIASLLAPEVFRELESRRKNAKTILNTFKNFTDLILVVENTERYYQRPLQLLFDVTDKPLKLDQAYTFEALRKYLYDKSTDRVKLVSEIKRLRRALVHISDPMAHLKHQALEDGVRFANKEAEEHCLNPALYQNIAQEALKTDYLKQR